MEPFGFVEMQQFQKELQEKYKDQWGGICVEKGMESILWMYGEIAEAADILKKRGEQAILHDPETRHHFVEEMTDVMMYFNDVCLCYEISPEELVAVYREKHERNMNRWAVQHD